MRVTPVNLNSSVLYNKQPNNKQQNQKNVSFGKIDVKHRDDILKHLPLSGDANARKQEIALLDNNYGVLLRWGGPAHQRGLVYADIDLNHAKNSPLKRYYYAMSPDQCAPDDRPTEVKGPGCINKLERQKYLNDMLEVLGFIAQYEDSDGHCDTSKFERAQQTKPTHTSRTVEKDNFDLAYELYGIGH